MLRVPKILKKFVIKVKNDHRSKFSNLSNWKEEAWKNQGFNGIQTRDLRHDTGVMLFTFMCPSIAQKFTRNCKTLVNVLNKGIWRCLKCERDIGTKARLSDVLKQLFWSALTIFVLFFSMILWACLNRVPKLCLMFNIEIVFECQTFHVWTALETHINLLKYFRLPTPANHLSLFVDMFESSMPKIKFRTCLNLIRNATTYIRLTVSTSQDGRAV